MFRGVIASALVVMPAAGECQAATAPATHTRGDPLEKVNRRLFAVHLVLDRALFRPVAMAYKTVVPRVLRTGIRHFFSNVGEPVVFLNDMLQLKPGRAARTLVRFSVNSTLGVGGLLDVATSDKLEHHDNGLGNTLARYGVKPGPYLFIPFVGPTDLRDLLGGQADGLVLPLGVGKPFDTAAYQISSAVLTGLDLRVESDSDLKVLLDGAVDPYATLRSVYLQNRAGEVAALRGKGASGALDDPLADPEAASGAPTPSAMDTPVDPEAPVKAPTSTTPDPTPPPSAAAPAGGTDTPQDPEAKPAPSAP